MVFLTPSASLAALFIGYAIQLNNGHLHPQAIFWIAAATLVLLFGVVFRPGEQRQYASDQLVLFTLAVGAAFQFFSLYTVLPGTYLIQGQSLSPFFGTIALAAMVAGMGLSNHPLIERWQPWLLVGLFCYAGHWMLTASSDPAIDVYIFQRNALSALLSGSNPYELTFPNIYGHDAYYGAGIVRDGFVQFGYPYPPLSLLLLLPGHLLGDFRYSQVIAIALTALMFTRIAPGPVGRAVAALYLFTPRVFFVLEQSWTEPLVVLMLTLTLWLVVRRPVWLPYAAGLMLATKQYMILALPLIYLLVRYQSTDAKGAAVWFAKMMLMSAVVTLPFFLWNPERFWQSIVTIQLLSPFRPDSLSFLAFLATDGRPPVSPYFAFLVAAIGIALTLWRAPANPAGFVASTALVFLLFFAFNKQAFCNYYFFVLGACCATVVASHLDAKPFDTCTN